MKLALVIVSTIAVFTADCRDLHNGPEDQDSTDNLQLLSDEPEDHVYADEPQHPDFSDEDQNLEEEPLVKTAILGSYTEEEEGETESRLRRYKCKARNACVVMGGFCVTNATLCNARLVPEGCKGTNCQCCVPDPVSQCVDENAMKETVNEGTDNVTRALEIKFNNLETELVTINNNATNSIKESVNQCVDETAMKATVNEGNNNVTRTLDTKFDNFKVEFQSFKENLNESNFNLQSELQSLGDSQGNLEDELQSLQNTMNKSISDLFLQLESITKALAGCPEGFFKVPGSVNQCFKFFTDSTRTWDAAKSKCQDEGLVLAKPNDRLALRKYIISKFGNKFAWLGGRGTGSAVKWDRDGTTLNSSDSAWYHYSTSTTSCLLLLSWESYMSSRPTAPYYMNPCTAGSCYALCESIM